MREQAQEVFNRLADAEPRTPGRRRTGRRWRWVSPQLVVATIALALLTAPLVPQWHTSSRAAANR